MTLTVVYDLGRTGVTIFKVTDARRTRIYLHVPHGMRSETILCTARPELSDLEADEVARALGLLD